MKNKYEVKKNLLSEKERKYYNNGIETTAINSLDKFIYLKDFRSQCDDIVETIYNILDNTNDVDVISNMENLVTRYLGYSENGYGYSDGKSFIFWKIQSFNMPEEIKSMLINLEKELIENKTKSL